MWRCARRADAAIEVDGADVVPDVHAVLDRMADFAKRVRSGEWKGHTGKRIRNVVNIGIGGSYLGPEMAYRGAAPLTATATLSFRFVSNVDGAAFTEATQDLDAAETLFVVSSKTFTTLETMTNADAARAWLVDALGRMKRRRQALCRRLDQRRRRVRSSASTPPTCSASGTGSAAATRWISAIGLSTMLAIGPENFRAMLAGFHAMDEHFRTAPPDKNLPVLLGLLTVWYNNFFGAETHGLMPYAQTPGALSRLPAAAADGEQRQERRPRRVAASTIRPARSSGASPAPTASTRSTSCCTRARS